MLRAVRFAAFTLIAALAGFYAGRVFWDRPPAAAGAPPPAALVAELPDFVLEDLAGEARNIGEWRGAPLLINFWATWCRPCREEMPLLQALHDERADAGGPTVIGIAVDRRPDVEAFVGEAGIAYPILIGQQDAMDAAAAFGPEFVGLPFSVLVAADGSVLGLHRGEIDAAELRSLVAVLDEVAAGRLSPAEARRRLDADGGDPS